MNDLSADALLHRVASLERDARRFKLFSAAATLVLVAATAIGATAVSRTAAPLAITQNGSTRIRLDGDGIHLYDGGGKQRLFIGFNNHNEPSIHLIDSGGEIRQSIYMDTLNNPVYNQLDSAGNIRQSMYLTKNYPSLDQQDKKGNVIASYYVNSSDGFGRIELAGSDKKDRFYLKGDNLPFLSFGDASYDQRTIFGLTREGSGLLRMKDRSGNDVVSIEGPEDGPFIRLSENNTERLNLGIFTDGSSGIQFKNSYGTQTGYYP